LGEVNLMHYTSISGEVIDRYDDTDKGIFLHSSSQEEVWNLLCQQSTLLFH